MLSSAPSPTLNTSANANGKRVLAPDSSPPPPQNGGGFLPPGVTYPPQLSATAPSPNLFGAAAFSNNATRSQQPAWTPPDVTYTAPPIQKPYEYNANASQSNATANGDERPRKRLMRAGDVSRSQSDSESAASPSSDYNSTPSQADNLLRDALSNAQLSSQPPSTASSAGGSRQPSYGAPSRLSQTTMIDLNSSPERPSSGAGDSQDQDAESSPAVVGPNQKRRTGPRIADDETSSPATPRCTYFAFALPCEVAHLLL